jgi:hypothetical protein
MARIWRSTAGQLLALYLVLDVLEFTYTRTVGASLNGHTSLVGQLLWLALETLLAWRAWHGGSIAWSILIVINGLIVVAAMLGTTWPWSLYLLGLLSFTAVQLSLLLSPAVRGCHKLRTQ